jgi:propanol-preferring alcohol dehydrogenase
MMVRKSIAGWPSGTSIDSEDALKFAAASGVRPMIEVFPLERAVRGRQLQLVRPVDPVAI